MPKNLVVSALTFALAFLILIVSVFRVAEIKYVLGESPSPTPEATIKPEAQVKYNLAYPGKIEPDSILWPLKALRDRVLVTLTLDPAKKADLYLLLADKRLANAKSLFEKDKADLGMSVLTKAEKYLESAQKEEIKAKQKGVNTRDFLTKFTLATLKHRQVLDEIMVLAPEDAKPMIMKNEDYSKKLYQDSKKSLLELGATTPVSPFKEN